MWKENKLEGGKNMKQIQDKCVFLRRIVQLCKKNKRREMILCGNFYFFGGYLAMMTNIK